jgi:hypothetical protein
MIYVSFRNREALFERSTWPGMGDDLTSGRAGSSRKVTDTCQQNYRSAKKRESLQPAKEPGPKVWFAEKLACFCDA